MLNKSGWGKYDPNGYGEMQVDRGTDPTASKDGPPFGQANVDDAAHLLREKFNDVSKQFPKLTEAQKVAHRGLSVQRR